MGDIYKFSDFPRGGKKMKFNSKDLSYLEQMAQEKLDDYGIDSIPVDPLEITAIAGIEVFNADFNETDTDVAGLIKKNGDDIRIYVNSFDAPARKRFTIAHELGHYFLHLQNEDGNFIDNKASFLRSFEDHAPVDARREAEANHFAAALLMPKGKITQEWKRSKSVSSMAKMFNVSIPAMENRLKYLGLK